MNRIEIYQLYDSISKDLSIGRFANESDKDFHFRLVYSALGVWALNAFRDRYIDEENQVSKSHVTLVLEDVLYSFLKVDPELKDYFIDIKSTVKTIEDTYINVGYVESGNYTFKIMNNKQRVALSDNFSLLIRNYLKNVKMVGLGLIKNRKKDDIDIDDFFKIKGDALSYFLNALKELRFSEFNDSFGKIEIYDIENNRWSFYNDKTAHKYEYSILRIDDGLDYRILMNRNNSLFYASLPSIYSKKEVDDFFKHEIWRIILGVCAKNSIPCKVKVSRYYDALLFELNGYILPYNEMSFIRCISWPLGNSCYSKISNVKGYIVPLEYEQIMYKLLNRFNICIEKVDD